MRGTINEVRARGQGDAGRGGRLWEGSAARAGFRVVSGHACL